MIEVKRRPPVVPQRPTTREEDKLAILRDCRERSKILRDTREELMAQYPDQWVAFGDNWDFVVADSLEEVMARLEKCGAYPPHSVITQLKTNRPRLRFKPLRRVAR